jgi:hypothetical protein
VTAGGGIVGVLLTHSINQQAESRPWEAEQGLELEAGTRALQLFTPGSGSLTHPIQRDGALFMLTNLGQHQLALQLLDNMRCPREN